MKVAAVVNIASGSVPRTAEEDLRAVLEEAGVDADIAVVEGDGVEDALNAAIDAGPDALLVWGGDGTAAFALQLAGPDGPPVLPVPGGTMNLLHKELYGGRDWKTCITDALAANAPKSIDAGEVAGRRFFIAAFFGRITRIAKSREAVRAADFGAALTNFFTSDALSLDPAVLIDDAQTVLAAGAFIGQTPGQLTFARLESEHPADIAAAVFETFLFDMRAADGVTVEDRDSVRISREDGKPVPAILDGEPMDLDGPVEVRAVPNAARVLSVPS